MTRQSRRVSPSIATKLEIFASMVNDNTSWFTPLQLAKIVKCEPSSLRPSFSYLRRNGFIVTSVRVPVLGCNLYNIKKGNMNRLGEIGKRSQRELKKTQEALLEKIAVESEF